MKRMIVLAILVVGGLSFGVYRAKAGEKTANTAWVSLDSLAAGGAMSDARQSADATQAISCTISYEGNGECWVEDAAGTFLRCGTFDPGFIRTIRSIASDSLIQIGSTPDGICNFIGVTNDSRIAPKSR